MKKSLLLYCFVACMTTMPLTGCIPSANSPTPPAAIAPGYNSTVDQQMGQTLAGATALYNKLERDYKAGTFTATQQEVTALNSLQAALTVANTTYVAYHNGNASLDNAQQAVQRVTAAQTNVQNMVGVK